MPKNAIVSLIAGKPYQQAFARHCHTNWKRYADRHNLGLILFEDLLDHSPRAVSRSPAWQKCLVFGSERCLPYDQVVWVDSDILINHAHAPNIFDTVPTNHVGAVQDYAYPTPDRYRQRLASFYAQWAAQGIHFVDNLTPEKFSTNWGLPPVPHVVQTGVIVASPQVHAPLFQHVYDTYDDKGSASWNYEMRPLSYELVAHAPLTWLDPRFNMVTIFAVHDDEVPLLQAPPSLLDRVLRKLKLDTLPVPNRKKQRLRQIHQRLLNESYFLHFAGRQPDMELLA